jgi:hypothetical protein
MAEPQHLQHLLRLRDEVFQEMEAADLEFSRLRMRLERMESDVRVGLPEPSGYEDLKGHAVPRAETRVLELFRNLLKLEDKILAARGS